jgi:V/A-type H+-transporting ATPase subunit I
MALEKSVKVAITVHASECGRLLAELRDRGLVEIISLDSTELGDLNTPASGSPGIPDLAVCDEREAQARFLVHTLKEFSPPEKLLDSLSDSRLEISHDEFLRRARSFDLERVYSEVASLKERIAEEEKELGTWLSEARHLEPFAHVDFPEGEFVIERTGSQRVGVKLFVAQPQHAQVIEELTAEPLVEVIPVRTRGGIPGRAESKANDTSDEVPYCIIFERSVRERVEDLLKEAGISEFEYEKLLAPGESPAGAYRRLIENTHAASERMRRLRERLSSYYSFLEDAMIAEDYWGSEGARARAARAGARTTSTLILTGWVLESKREELEEYVAQRPYAALDIIDPDEEEVVPVTLRNRPFFRPLELITRLYGMPLPDELDPTPLFSVFFLIYFGMCVGDAGYGILLAAGAYAAEKKLKLTETAKSFAHIIKWSGAAAIVFGVLTGSYFAVDARLLPDALLKLRVLDPIQDPQVLLLIAIGFGIVQILFGIVLSMVKRSYKEGWLRALLVDGGRFSVIAGTTGYIAFSALGSSTLTEAGATLSRWTAITGVLLTLFFSAGFSVSWVKRPLLGLYNLYNFTGYLGDIISYARLMAIGLASGLIGLSVNIIVSLLSSSIYGAILGILVFVAGHLFNLLIGLIGAFVHPLRLQFVEFFKQFYENGGKELQPLKWPQRNVKFVYPHKEVQHGHNSWS